MDAFRWLKCILGCRHWLAESERGVALQVYLARIAAQLLVLYRGERPNRRQMEAIQFYLMGWASVDELMTILRPRTAKTAAAQMKKAERLDRLRCAPRPGAAARTRNARQLLLCAGRPLSPASDHH